MSTTDERAKILKSMFNQISYDEQTDQIIDLVKEFSYNQRMRIIEGLFGDQSILVDENGHITKNPLNTIIRNKK